MGEIVQGKNAKCQGIFWSLFMAVLLLLLSRHHFPAYRVDDKVQTFDSTHRGSFLYNDEMHLLILHGSRIYAPHPTSSASHTMVLKNTAYSSLIFWINQYQTYINIVYSDMNKCLKKIRVHSYTVRFLLPESTKFNFAWRYKTDVLCSVKLVTLK